MNTTTLQRLTGYALVVAAVGCIAGGLLHPVVDGDAHSVASIGQDREPIGSAFLLTGTALLLIALPTVYGRVASRLGWFGLWGYLLTMVGNLLCALPHVLVMSLIGPTVAEEAPRLISEHDNVIAAGPFETEQAITGIMLLAGLLVLGIALVRDKEMPRWIGWCGVLGAVVALAPIPVTAVLSGVQFELLRGLMIAGLGLYVARLATADRERTALEPVGA